MTVVIFLIVLAVLIFVHELGHFLAARLFGVRVEAFKIGFGPKILVWRRGETEYGVNAIPFGGYVKIFGENGDEATDPRSFVRKSRWQQAIMLAAGVLFNFLFAWLLYVIVFANGVAVAPEDFGRYSSRFQNQRVIVAQFLSDSPAQKAGLEKGDSIVSINNQGGLSMAEIQATIDSSEGKPLDVVYKRGQTEKTVSVAPIQGLVSGKYAIGIAMTDAVDLKLPFFTAIGEGFRYTLVVVKETSVGLYSFLANIFRGAADFSQVSGPVGIAGIVGSAAGLGFPYLLMVTAIISVNLGVINLVPFPALDGGRILIVIIEAVVRRRVPAKVSNAVNAVGFALLILLMIAVTWKDIAGLMS